MIYDIRSDSFAYFLISETVHRKRMEAKFDFVGREHMSLNHALYS